MGMTPRGLRRLDEGARITEAEERRLAVMRARRKLDAALEALEEGLEGLEGLLEALEEARAQLAAQPAMSVMLGPIAARIGHRATNAAEAALELAHASEVARGRR